MNNLPKTPKTRNQDTKTLLSALKMTTTIGAVSLTLAGWGLLARVEANSLVQAAQSAPAGFASAAPLTSNGTSVTTGTGMTQSGSAPAVATAGRTPAATTLPRSTATPIVTPTALPKMPAPAPAPSPTPLFKLDVVQWVQTQAGDPVAVVRDNRGTLWFVMGTDVPRIENGLTPQYQPQPVNGVRSRRS